MYNEFDRGLFATVLIAMAVLLSLTGVARFPGAFQQSSSGHETAYAAPDDQMASALR